VLDHSRSSSSNDIGPMTMEPRQRQAMTRQSGAQLSWRLVSDTVVHTAETAGFTAVMGKDSKLSCNPGTMLTQ